MNISKVKEIINKKNISFVILVIFISFAIGLIYNALQPEPLSLIYKKNILAKIDDNILFEKPLLEIKSGETAAKPTNEKFEVDTVNKESIKQSKEIVDDNKLEHSEQDIVSNKSATNSPAQVTYTQMLKIIKSSDFVILDARSEEVYSRGHIPKAINISALDTPENKVFKILELPQNKKIVIYCDGGNCDLSHELAKELITAFNFTNVFVYEGGWEEWSVKYKGN